MWEEGDNVSLIIKEITEADAGIYRMVAKNELGEADSDCRIIIKCA